MDRTILKLEETAMDATNYSELGYLKGRYDH